MKFNWNKGCLPREDYLRVADAIEAINSAIMIPSMGGFIEDGVDYCAIDFIADKSELKYAVLILKDFVNSCL